MVPCASTTPKFAALKRCPTSVSLGQSAEWLVAEIPCRPQRPDELSAAALSFSSATRERRGRCHIAHGGDPSRDDQGRPSKALALPSSASPTTLGGSSMATEILASTAPRSDTAGRWAHQYRDRHHADRVISAAQISHHAFPANGPRPIRAAERTMARTSRRSCSFEIVA